MNFAQPVTLRRDRITISLQVIMRASPVIMLSLLLAAASAAAQTSIVLLPAARVERTEPVRLKHIATLAGPDADRLGEALLLNNTGAARTGVTAQSIDLAAVRAALDTLKVNWGRVTLSGSHCTLNPDAAMAAPGAPPARKPTVSFEQGDTIPAGTIKRAIAQRLADLHAVDLASIRLAFRPVDDQVAFLAQPVTPDQRVQATPGASSASGRVGVRVEVYEGSRLAYARTVNADVLLRRVAALAAAPLDRGESVGAGTLASEERWLSPSADVPMREEELVGQTARRRLEPGKPISRDDVRPPTVVNRGDIVWVHVLSGTVSMKAKARALDSALDGEEVALQVDGSNKPFKARMSGRGTAVLQCTGGTESFLLAENLPAKPRERSRGGR